MKVLVKSYEDDEGRTLQKLFIDGEEKESIGYCEPEDAIIGRDLISADQIASYMKRAVDAVKKGEEFSIEEVECKTEDEFDE